MRFITLILGSLFGLSLSVRACFISQGEYVNDNCHVILLHRFATTCTKHCEGVTSRNSKTKMSFLRSCNLYDSYILEAFLISILTVRRKIKIVRNFALGLPLYEYGRQTPSCSKQISYTLYWDVNKNAEVVLSLLEVMDYR